MRHLLMMLLSLVFIFSCSDNNSPVTIDQTANVTIQINPVDGSSVIDASVTLENETGNINHVFHRTAASSTINFTNIIYGTYTLIIRHDNFHVRIESGIEIRSRYVSHYTFLVPVTMSYRVISIQNQTDNTIQSLFIRNIWNDYWGNNLLSSNLINRNKFTLVLFDTVQIPNQIDIRLIDINTDTYTKYFQRIEQNDVIIFTSAHRDSNQQIHYRDLFDSERFDLLIEAGHSTISVRPFINFYSITLRINDEIVNLAYDPQIGDYWSFYDFIPGITYKFEVYTSNPRISETANLTIVQGMNIQLPPRIYEGPISLNWSLIPNNFNDSDMQVLFLEHFELDWIHLNHLPNSSRNYTIPPSFIPSSDFGNVYIDFEQINFSLQGRTSFMSFRAYFHHYFDGNLEGVRDLSSDARRHLRASILRDSL